MGANRVQQIIESAYNREIAKNVISAYKEIEGNYFLQKWKPSELDAGHFVESVRRLLELELTGTFTPFSSQLSNFSDQVLKGYEQNTGHESFRMLIPRILKSIYNIRNKRGVGHITDISPNEMDSTLILHSVKWVLSEIVRIKTNISISDTQKLIDSIVERQLDLIWKETDFRRVLKVGMPAKDQVLVLLYDVNSQNVDALRDIIEYKNKTKFMEIIRKLHKERYLELKSDNECIISPKGVLMAEEIINKAKYSI